MQALKVSFPTEFQQSSYIYPRYQLQPHVHDVYSDGSTQEESEGDYDHNITLSSQNLQVQHSQYLNNQNPKQSYNQRNSKYKIQLCRNFKTTGVCPYGSKCQYAHGQSQLRFNNIATQTENQPIQRANEKYKTKLCREFFKKGYCIYGETCNYLHRNQKQSNQFAEQQLKIEKQEGMLQFLQVKMLSQQRSKLFKVLQSL